MDKLVVITGITKGIGRAIAEKFASQGFDVAGCSRSTNELEKFEKEVKAKYNTQVFVTTADLSLKEDCRRFSSYVSGLQRPVDVLVNNAGYFIPGEIVNEDDGVLESMISANLYSAYNVTRGIAPDMKRRKAGHIFNICSVASIKAYPNGGSYAISKFALLGLSKSLREELKNDQIRVTAILPGAVRTASWEGTELPDDRFMSSEDIADAVFTCYALSGRTVVEEILLRPQLGDI